MRQLLLACLTLLASQLTFATEAGDFKQAFAALDIPHQRFVLDNGLTLIVHEDHKAPLVAVNLWYHVGSKNEQPGKTGFAHLFEHLMFNGSENHDDEFFRPLEAAGASTINGTTNSDRTNYFQVVPKNALDLVLWLESDRMGHLLGAITQEKLDEQRDVVKNEKRQRENQPYGKVWNLLSQHSYPHGHPYSWPVIGSMDDLNAASLDDVHNWFKAYYGPNNATLVIAGDVNTADVRQKVQHYFGTIKPNEPITRPQNNPAPLTAPKRIHTQDRVPQARFYRSWNVPALNDKTSDDLDLITSLLAGSKTSRLYQRLVYNDQIATDVGAYLSPGELGSRVLITASAKPGVALATLETAIDDELQQLRTSAPPTTAELDRLRTAHYSGLVRMLERIGGYRGKAEILAMSQVLGGKPDAWRDGLQHILNATPDSLQATLKQWLGPNHLTINVEPYPEFAINKARKKGLAIDRSRLPKAGDAPDLTLPKLQRATLNNGLKIILAERHETPVVEFKLLAQAGFAADKLTLPGTASLTMSMLDEGAAGKTALELSTALENLGASTGARAGLDHVSIGLSALSAKLEPALAIYANIIRQPDFPETDLARLKTQRLAAIAQEQNRPFSMALRHLPPQLFGKDHAYGQPLTGSGDVASVNAITRQHLIDYHQTWIRPDNATLLIVGDTTLTQIQPLLENHFADWQAPKTALPTQTINPVKPASEPMIYLVDRPKSTQSLIIAGQLAPPKTDADDLPLTALNSILGGLFTSRLNMNLREDKGWSYGAGSTVLNTIGQRAFIAYAQVQTDQTAAAIQEALKEINAIRDDKPATATELTQAQNSLTLKLPGQNETTAEVLSTLSQLVTFNLPDDYYNQYISRMRELNPDDINRTAQRVLQPQQLVWVVIGDLSKITAQIEQLDFANSQVLARDSE